MEDNKSFNAQKLLHNLNLTIEYLPAIAADYLPRWDEDNLIDQILDMVGSWTQMEYELVNLSCELKMIRALYFGQLINWKSFFEDCKKENLPFAQQSADYYIPDISEYYDLHPYFSASLDTSVHLRCLKMIHVILETFDMFPESNEGFSDKWVNIPENFMDKLDEYEIDMEVIQETKELLNEVQSLLWLDVQNWFLNWEILEPIFNNQILALPSKTEQSEPNRKKSAEAHNELPGDFHGEDTKDHEEYNLWPLLFKGLLQALDTVISEPYEMAQNIKANSSGQDSVIYL